jgi:uncharacterized protein (TIGR00369 family)
MPLTDDQLVERFNRMKAPTGVVFNAKVLAVDSAKGWVRMSFDVGPQYCNPGGSVQGGIVTALLDDAAAFACIVKSGERIFVATLELKTVFLAPARQGLLFAEAQCIKYGKSIAFMEAELQDEEGRILAKMTTTTAPRRLDRPPVLIDTANAPA